MKAFFLFMLSSIFLTSLTYSDMEIQGNNERIYEKQDSKEDAKVKGHVTVTPWELW